MVGAAGGVDAAAAERQKRCLAAVAGVEDVVLGVLRTASRAEKVALTIPGAAEVEVATIRISDPCHALVAENGGFCAGTDRERRLELKPKNYRRLARLFSALNSVHQLNTSRRSATQRELFYRAVASLAGTLFRTQKQMDLAIRDAVGVLRIGRPHLGILTTEKGRIAGAVSFRDPQTSAVSNAAQSASGMAITEAMFNGDDSSIQVGNAHCVLVVEKDSFFQHLLQGRLLAVLPLILITGRGYPDMLTQRLLQRIQRIAPQLPQVFLGDYDPHGFHIYLSYRVSCPTLRWLGMHEADVRGLPAEASIPLTKHDRALQASLLRCPAVQEHQPYAAQVRAMERKFELEALHAVHGPEQVALHFVPEKVLRRAWI